MERSVDILAMLSCYGWVGGVWVNYIQIIKYMRAGIAGIIKKMAGGGISSTDDICSGRTLRKYHLYIQLYYIQLKDNDKVLVMDDIFKGFTVTITYIIVWCTNRVITIFSSSPF